MGLAAKACLLLVLSGCSAENPLYGLVETDEGGSAAAGGTSTGQNASITGGGDSGTGPEQDTDPAECAPVPAREFGVRLESAACNETVDWQCRLAMGRGGWELRSCCTQPSDKCPPIMPIDFFPIAPNEKFNNTQVRVRASFDTLQARCEIRSLEIFDPTQTLPIFVGANIVPADLTVASVDYLPPEIPDSCACASDAVACCAEGPPGSYSASFSVAASPAGIELAEGETFAGMIGDLGPLEIRNFVAHRAQQCEAPLEVDWVATQP